MSEEASIVRYDVDENETISGAIIAALSQAKGRDITEQECVLYNNIDPDALDSIFRREGTDDTIKVEFTTHEAIVLLWGDGAPTVEVQDLEEDPNYG